MPRMRPELDVLAPKVVLFGLVAAVAAFAGTLLLAAVGQAVGALLGGCAWIGLSTPVDRQVWALVNQPALHFATQTRSLGYWTGSYLLPLAVALAAVPLLPRPRTIASELAVLHAAWAATVVGIAWLPLIDPADGHLWRWLDLWDLPSGLAWVAPALAIPAAVPATLRLLALLRVSRHHAGRLLRLAAVMVHLGLPAIAWVALAAWARGAPPVPSAIGVGTVLMVGLSVAWFGYPPPFVERLQRLRAASWVRLVAAAAALVAVVLLSGRPLPADRRGGLLWSRPTATNNVRPWIEPISLGALADLPSGSPEVTP
jgi:hypothetical protein